MKKVSIVVCLFLFFFMTNNIVNAATCEREEKKRLKALAEKVEFTYDYELIETKDETGRVVEEPIFSITASNLNPELKVTIMEDYFQDKYQEFKDGNNTSASIRGFVAGEKIPITIYGFVPNGCSGIEVFKKYVKIPYYNSFSEDKRCEEYPDFKYCSDLLSSTIKESVFEAEFKRYIASLQPVEEIPEPEKKVDIMLIVEVAGAIIAVATVIIYIIVRRKKKYSL